MRKLDPKEKKKKNTRDLYYVMSQCEIITKEMMILFFIFIFVMHDIRPLKDKNEAPRVT